MSFISRLGLCAAACLLTASAALAQPAPDAPPALTAADYARAEKFMTYNTTPLVLRTGVRAVVAAGRPVRSLLVPRDDGEGRRGRAGGSRKGRPSRACDLPPCKAAEREDPARAGGGGFGGRYAELSPDGKRTAFIRDWNLWVRDVAHRPRNAAHQGRRQGLRLRHRQRRLDAQRPPDPPLVARLEEDRDVPAGSARRRRDVSRRHHRRPSDAAGLEVSAARRCRPSR